MHLKELRTRMGLTQKQLADQMDTTQQTVARWESGKTPLNIEHIKDLCILLHCSADELLGWESSPSEQRHGPFAAGHLGLPFGTLTLQLTTGERKYPIETEGRGILERQLRSSLAHGDSKERPSWLEIWTLDNNILLVNAAALSALRLVSDDIEAMPRFELPEVYRALADWYTAPATGILRGACDDVIDWLGEEEAVSRASDLRVHCLTGAVLRFPLTDTTVTEIFEILVQGCRVSKKAFLMVEDDEAGEQRTFVNLDAVALIEVPLDLYKRMTA